MQKKVWLFAGPLAVLSAAGALLRRLELRESLDPSTMLMDLGAPSVILLAVSLVALLFTALLSRRFRPEDGPASYGRNFRGVGMAAVSAAALLLTLAGAVLCMRERQASGFRAVLPALASLLAALAGVGWLSLSLDALRRKPDRYLPALLPVLFTSVFLVYYYKEYASQPAMLYTLYPFLALCAALSALHCVSGYTVNRLRPRLTVFLCFAGVYLGVVAAAGADNTAFLLFLLAITLELAAHGISLLLPHPLPPAPEPESEKEVPSDAAPEPGGDAETPREAEPEE